MGLLVFPAYAGMSPGIAQKRRGACGFPRLRGDEPATIPGINRPDGFSPPTRG